jgi:hypothetical protein
VRLSALRDGCLSSTKIRGIWDKRDWLFDGQHRFRPGYSCESQVITVCQDIADPLDNGGKIDAIIIDFPKAFALVSHDRLLTIIAASGVGSRAVVFLLSRTQRVRVGGQLYEEGRVTSGVPQGSVLGPLLLLVYVNNIWRNIESNIRLFADYFTIYRKILNNNNVESLQIDLNRLRGFFFNPILFASCTFTFSTWCKSKKNKT